ncbi:hypothetical protein [Granulicella sp. dw_53]|uniref:hypothetical protein n=1 Tax=Granulicella sp. dw_53 TaxID=2719792 RepID=UPI001BD6A051|nr:hypothetical protein [Granulicella sp. dw_53]
MKTKKVLDKDSAEALILLWAMVTTRADWLLGAQEEHFEALDMALNLTPGFSSYLWCAAKSDTSVPAAATFFKNFVAGNFRSACTKPDTATVDPWSTDGCRMLGNYVQILNPDIDLDTFPDIVTAEVPFTASRKSSTR